MPLCLFRSSDTVAPRLGLITDERVIEVGAAGGPPALVDALTMPAAELQRQLDSVRANGGDGMPLDAVSLSAPIDQQEVWAAGVTYLRSRDARMEESTQKDIYDRVYEAERPELFLKATPSRVSGPGEEVAIRQDSTWDVPEPELALVLNRDRETVGYTIGNDVSSRSIEGENPLYLPQAKVYSKSAALGPVIALAWELSDTSNLPIRLVIRRNGSVLFDGNTSTSQIHRPLAELVDYLWRDNEFPYGAVLMTGTGIIPPSEFTLEHGDDVAISIAGIGELRNPVIRLAAE
ncbi:MAG TPA: fumarylacetoacetate hydrolase family protein [Thermomicrobiales bacterium]|nr:fumarylacetoacetate hydrolase family protein [Thermomicrobiales bacterium]